MSAATPGNSKAPKAFVPPVQFYFSGSPEESLPPDDREIAITSLEHATKVPSMSSFGSSTASTRYMAVPDAGYFDNNSVHGSSTDMTSNNDTEQQSDFLDDKTGPTSGEDPKSRRQQRSIPPLWLVVLVSLIGLMIILLSVFLSSDSSSTKFEVGLTSSPTMPTRTKAPTLPPTVPLRTNAPSSSPTYDVVMDEAVDAEIIVTGDDYFDEQVEEQPGGHGALYEVARVFTESGAAEEQLGLKVAVGGNARVVMLGKGFIRVVEWSSSSSPGALTWPLKPSSVTKTGFGKSKPVGRDIHFDVKDGGETPSLAMSGDGQRIAMVIDATLFVWEFEALDEQWKLIFLDSILQDGCGAAEGDIMPTGVTMSYHGRTIVAGTVALTTDGLALVVRMWHVEDAWVKKGGIQFVKMLEDYRPSESGPLNLELSNTGSVLAVCLNEIVLVKAVGDVEYDENLTFDLESDDGSESITGIETFQVLACGLSGDGRAIAVSKQNRNDTFVYSSRDSSWRLDSVLQTSGSSVSLDKSGRFVAVGGSPGGVISLWGQNQNGFDYHLVYQVRSDGGSGSKSFESVALSNEATAAREHFMAVGNPVGDGGVDIYQINEFLLV